MMSTSDQPSYQEDAEFIFRPEENDSRVKDWGPPAEYQPAPGGLCWHNARGVARENPEMYLYAEGLVFIGGEWVGHGWVVRKTDGAVIECTEDYGAATKYRGICLEIDFVDDFIDGRPSREDGKTCWERWDTTYDDGSTRSKAPSLTAILAEEANAGVLHATEWWKALHALLDTSACRP